MKAGQPGCIRPCNRSQGRDGTRYEIEGRTARVHKELFCEGSICHRGGMAPDMRSTLSGLDLISLPLLFLSLPAIYGSWGHSEQR